MKQARGMKPEKSLEGLRFLYPYLSRYKKQFVIVFVAMALVAATSALSAYIFKYILNDIFISRDEKMLVLLPLMVISIFTVRGIARFTNTYMMTKIGVSVANSMRQLMFSHLVDAEFSASQQVTTGDINAAIIQTALNIQNIITSTLPQLIVSAMTVVALTVVVLYTNLELALYAVVIGLLMVIPVKILSKGVKRHTVNSENMVIELSNRSNETFNNLDLVKIYNTEAAEKRSFERFLDRYAQFQAKLAKYRLLSSPFMEFFLAIAISAVIYLGGHYVIDGEMTVGDFFAFILALMMLYAPIKTLTQNYVSLYMLSSYIQRVKAILRLPLERYEGEPLEKIQRIVFDRVGYTIGEHTILKDISFEIEEGDRIAIVGKSGAGKSSLISLLFGLGHVSSGEIRINTKPLEQYSRDAFRQQISYVNQNAGIFNTSLQENILYGDTLDKQRYEQAKTEAQCDFMDQMPEGDQTVAGEFGNRLSGGQRQRIALARAIYRQGSLFVLDEATSALDANTESLIQESLENVMQERTSIIIAHRLATIEKCNKVIVIEAGRIVAYGQYDEVSQSEAFRRNFMMEGIA
jgi:subfamily B ATP-binding cassette protein MsbA